MVTGQFGQGSGRVRLDNADNIAAYVVKGTTATTCDWCGEEIERTIERDGAGSSTGADTATPTTGKPQGGRRNGRPRDRVGMAVVVVIV